MKGGMNDLLRQAQVMQKKLADATKALETRTVEAQSGGGMVKAVVNGGMELISLTIDPAAADPKDVEMLQDMVITAVREAGKKAKAMKEAELGKLTGGLNIPGLF